MKPTKPSEGEVNAYLEKTKWRLSISFICACVRLCTCVCAWNADSQNRQDQKM